MAGLLSIVGYLVLDELNRTNRSVWGGLAFIVFGGLISTSYRGTQIDVSGKRFRLFQAILGYRFGKWESLPTLAGIYSISHSGEYTNLPNGISPTLSGKVTDYHVLAVSADLEPLFYLTYPAESQARKVARELATGLGVPLKN